MQTTLSCTHSVKLEQKNTSYNKKYIKYNYFLHFNLILNLKKNKTCMQNHQKAILISWSMTVWHNDLVTCYDIVLLNLLSNGHELHESAYYCSSDQHKGIICLNVVTWISYLGLEREALKVFNRTWQCDVSSIKNQFNKSSEHLNAVLLL